MWNKRYYSSLEFFLTWARWFKAVHPIWCCVAGCSVTRAPIHSLVSCNPRPVLSHFFRINFMTERPLQQSTGDTTELPLYGRDLNTPHDLWISLSHRCMAEFVHNYKMELTSALWEAYDDGRESLVSSQKSQKKHYGKKCCWVSFCVSD